MIFKRGAAASSLFPGVHEPETFHGEGSTSPQWLSFSFFSKQRYTTDALNILICSNRRKSSPQLPKNKVNTILFDGFPNNSMDHIANI